MDERRTFHGLVDTLAASAEPYGVAARLMEELLLELDELRRETGAFLEDMETLARLQGRPQPEVAVAEIRLDLGRMDGLPERLGLGELFSESTRHRCGRAGVPVLAAALWIAGSWVELSRSWLENADGLRIRVDVELHQRLQRRG